MNAKSGIIVLIVFFTTLTTSAQEQWLGEAFQEFSTSRFWSHEDIQIVWNMEGSIQADLNDGINHLLEEKPKLAEYSLSTVLLKDSTLWQAYYYRAAALKQQNKFTAAQRDLQRALKFHPDFYEGYIELAKVFHLQGMNIESERALKKAIQLDKSRAVAYYLLGDVDLEQDQLKSAIAQYQNCLKVDSLFHDARIKLSIIDLIAKKNEAEAIKHLNTVLGYDSLQRSALLFRSILTYKINKAQTVRDLSNLILVSPFNIMAYFFRGSLLTEFKEYDQAFADFQKVIKSTATSDNNFAGKQTWIDKKIDIQNVGAYTLTRVYGLSDDDGAKLKQAYCYIITQKYDSAIIIINETTNPTDEPLANYLKAVSYEHKGEHNKALQFYNRALVLDDDIADAHKKRGIYAQELKQWNQSVKDFTDVLRLTPDAFVIYKIRGVSHYYNNQFEEAIADYTEYLKRDSVNREIISFRGMAYLQNKQRLRAYTDFAQSRRLQGLNFIDMTHVVDSTLALGDTTLVLAALTQFSGAVPYYTEGFIRKFRIHMARNEWKPIDEDINYAVRNSRVDVPKSDHAYLLTLQAMNLARNKHGEDALKKFDEAIRLDKNNALAYLERGRLLLTTGKTAKAESDLQQASALGNMQAKELLATTRLKGN